MNTRDTRFVSIAYYANDINQNASAAYWADRSLGHLAAQVDDGFHKLAAELGYRVEKIEAERDEVAA